MKQFLLTIVFVSKSLLIFTVYPDMGKIGLGCNVI